MDGKDDIVSFVKQIIALDPETDGEQIAELDWLINAKVYITAIFYFDYLI